MKSFRYLNIVLSAVAAVAILLGSASCGSTRGYMGIENHQDFGPGTLSTRYDVGFPSGGHYHHHHKHKKPKYKKSKKYKKYKKYYKKHYKHHHHHDDDDD